MPNIFRPTFEDGERPEGFRSRRARIGHDLILSGDLVSIEAGAVHREADSVGESQ